MNTIIVDKECGCFKKSAYENNMKFESKDDALMQANLMIKYMNTKFCGKHDFTLAQNENEFLISVGMKESGQGGGCCGGGHCS
ncbi:MAG: hypothetical protein U9R16_08435 [Campylobacterota bacterium]|nr:hypothetical protein [Campylobacterota bacterium]